MIVRNGKTTHLIGRDISYIMFENEDGDELSECQPFEFSFRKKDSGY